MTEFRPSPMWERLLAKHEDVMLIVKECRWPLGKPVFRGRASIDMIAPNLGLLFEGSGKNKYHLTNKVIAVMRFEGSVLIGYLNHRVTTPYVELDVEDHKGKTEEITIS